MLRAALEAGIADGTILGYNVLDEPPHPSWGGGLTKATVDTMAAYCKWERAEYQAQFKDLATLARGNGWLSRAAVPARPKPPISLLSPNLIL